MYTCQFESFIKTQVLRALNVSRVDVLPMYCYSCAFVFGQVRAKQKHHQDCPTATWSFFLILIYEKTCCNNKGHEPWCWKKQHILPDSSWQQGMFFLKQVQALWWTLELEWWSATKRSTVIPHGGSLHLLERDGFMHAVPTPCKTKYIAFGPPPRNKAWLRDQWPWLRSY